MKTIVLMPVKNEGWILRSTLEHLSHFSDEIIAANQSSIDDTVEICRAFPKVRVVHNPSVGHDNSVRWLLLKEARKSEGFNLIICIDADEIISPSFIKEIQRKISVSEIIPGSGISVPWINIFGSKDQYRVDGVWGSNIKSIAFLDDRHVSYNTTLVMNDHTSRIPEVSIIHHISEYPLLHLQSLCVEKDVIKQIWYRCNEFIRNPKEVRRINNRYSITDINKVKTKEIKKEWINDLTISDIHYNKKKDWRYQEILGWFDTYGINFFEPLDIWAKDRDIFDRFHKKNGRNPVVKKYAMILVQINRLRNYLRNRLLKP